MANKFEAVNARMSSVQFCCCFPNITGAKIIAVLSVIDCIINIAVAVSLTMLQADTLETPSWVALAWLEVAFSLIACVCIIMGLVTRRPKLLTAFVVVQIVALITSIVFGIMVLTTFPPEAMPIGVTSGSWIGIAMSAALEIWFLLIVIGAKRDMARDLQLGYIAGNDYNARGGTPPIGEPRQVIVA